MLKNSLPHELAKLRSASNLSYRELSSRSGVSKTVLAAIEAGQAGNVRLLTVKKLADYFGKTLDEITGNTTPVSARYHCRRCGGRLQRGERHWQEQCILHLHSTGKTDAEIASRFEIGAIAVRCIRDDLSRRLDRRLRL